MRDKGRISLWIKYLVCDTLPLLGSALSAPHQAVISSKPNLRECKVRCAAAENQDHKQERQEEKTAGRLE